MKTTILASAFLLGLTAMPALAQDFVLPSAPRNGVEQRLQDRVDAQIQINRARGLYSPGEIRRQERYERRDRPQRRWEREDRRRWDREDRRQWEREDRRRDRW